MIATRGLRLFRCPTHTIRIAISLSVGDNSEKKISQRLMERKSPTTSLISFALLISVLIPISVIAHPLHSHQTSFTDGLAHGLTSWNHLLIALSIGFLGRIALTHTQFGWGKALIATTAIYTIAHSASLSSSVWAAPGVIVGFLSMGLAGVALGHLTIERPTIQRFRFAGSIVALAILALTW